MAEPLPTSSTISQGDAKEDRKGTPENGKKGLSLSLSIVKVLRSEPDRPFVVRDLVDRTGGNYSSVKRILSRLASPGKGAGPVRRARPGIYQFAPEKENDSLRALVRSGQWKIENLRFVSLGAQGRVMSLPVTEPKRAHGTPSDSSQPTPHPGYPWMLDTGQLVTWEDYRNGTQVIQLSAHGAPPISPDHAITIISSLKKNGLDDSWVCVSVELNIDSYRHHIDANFSLQSTEGLLLKAYQHGYNTRLEIADRREVPLREVIEIFHAIAGGIENREALRQVKAMEGRIAQCEKASRLALSVATKVRDGKQTSKDTSKPKYPVTFRTAAELLKAQAEAVPGRALQNEARK